MARNGTIREAAHRFKANGRCTNPKTSASQRQGNWLCSQYFPRPTFHWLARAGRRLGMHDSQHRGLVLGHRRANLVEREDLTPRLGDLSNLSPVPAIGCVCVIRW
jgi:hypothetical protein